MSAKKAGAQRLGFKTGEFIIYPAHGLGKIVSIEEQEIAGFKLELFVVSFMKEKMTLRVPTAKIAQVGMRKLSDAATLAQALDVLTGRARVKRTMWSRRAQEYEAKINSGDIIAVSEVVRDLTVRGAAGAVLLGAPALRGGPRAADERDRGGRGDHRDRSAEEDRGEPRQEPAPRQGGVRRRPRRDADAEADEAEAA